MEKKTLTPEEITSLKLLNSNFQNLKEQIGDVEIQMMNLSILKDKLKIDLSDLQKLEIEIAQSLETKYGEGSISLKDGEFIPSK